MVISWQICVGSVEVVYDCLISGNFPKKVGKVGKGRKKLGGQG